MTGASSKERVDSRFRGNDGGGVNGGLTTNPAATQPPPGFWIPAYAGMTVGG